MQKFSITAVLTVIVLLFGSISTAYAEVAYSASQSKSAEQIAKELANPASSLASISMNLQYTKNDGDLPGASDQNSMSFIFQPVLPLPVGDKGRNIIVRPAVPVLFDQPMFKAATGNRESADTELADISFDMVYAGTTMTSKGNGYLTNRYRFGGHLADRNRR